ncbi:HPP family protein [Lysinibacillus yapensis]|uniref:HPP family protein n=1 Tax=Ureibacillus yapensis TaxID=2304605 RepID=A0A396S5L3_9BACL|nr:HPP family protein [Lysinibacillus yapensis]RHW35787.1 HPP family protein [Lysinibacillus yapensis]
MNYKTQTTEQELRTYNQRIRAFFKKIRGYPQTNNRSTLSDALIASIGAFICMLTIVQLTEYTHSLWFIASFGASSMLVMTAWNAPVGQPRNVIGSHLIASFISVGILQLFGSSPLTMSLALCITIFCMLMTRTFHPPACGDTIIIMINAYSWSFLVEPVLMGTIVIVAFGLIINNLHPRRKYPLYWW